jgi:diguanylate cyclase (GGDEF)-like protein
MVAPAIRANFSEYKRLFTYLKKKGVNKIYDVSLGADICTWAHVKYAEKYGVSPTITQPCPPVVMYCEIYHHDLLKNLSPIHSPMACTSIYMRTHDGITDRIAALSPCIAKSAEFDDTGIAEYNVTFRTLIEYLEKHKIKLPMKKTDFDSYERGLGALFPMPGGLKENIEFFTGSKLSIANAEGFDVFKKIDTYSRSHKKLLPDVFDVLNCREGCNSGTACLHKKSVFEIDSTMRVCRMTATEKLHEYSTELYKEYDTLLELEHFQRKYRPIKSVMPKVTKKVLERASQLLFKTTTAKQNVNCGACGSGTCKEMARKIALNVNIPENCLVKSRDDVKELAYYDALTKVSNRRHFMEQCAGHISRLHRSKGNSYIAILDLDHFKKVNDTYGHLAGDMVLKTIAQRIKKIVRPYDLFGRYGGEEFVLFISDINRQDAMQIMERFRLEVCNESVIFEKTIIPASASFGVSPVTPIFDLETALKRADECLYKAKESGRNRVIFFEET